MRNSVPTFVSAVTVALALSSCGGGGSTPIPEGSSAAPTPTVDAATARAEAAEIVLDQVSIKELGKRAQGQWKLAKATQDRNWNTWSVKTLAVRPAPCTVLLQLNRGITPKEVTTRGKLTAANVKSGDDAVLQYLVTGTESDALSSELGEAFDECTKAQWRINSGWLINDDPLVDKGTTKYFNKQDTPDGYYQWDSASQYVEHDCDRFDPSLDCANRDQSTRRTAVTIFNELMLVTTANDGARDLVVPGHEAALSRLTEKGTVTSSPSVSS